MKTSAPRIVVGGLIKKGSKYLLVKEKLESGRDLWIIPGGGLEEKILEAKFFTKNQIKKLDLVESAKWLFEV